jgi:hypothetical protein
MPRLKIGTGSWPYKRRWRDGPTWDWLCRVFGHQKEWYHWYASAGDQLGTEIARALGWGSGRIKPHWHRHGTDSANGFICGRCGKAGI